MPANLPRLIRRMDELSLDAIVATTDENVRYLSDVPSIALDLFPHSGQFYAVVTRDRPDRPHLVSSRCDVDQLLDGLPRFGGVVGYGTFFREPPDPLLPADLAALTEAEDALRRIAVDGPAPATPLEALLLVLRDLGLAGGRIAVDENGVPDGFAAALRERAPGLAVQAGAAILQWTRKVKTQAELARLAAVVADTEDGIRAVAAAVKPGATERGLVREFESALLAAGTRPRFSFIKFGRAGVAGQARPTDEPLSRGDSVWMDVGGVRDGYWSDIARVFALGEPSDRLVRCHAASVAGEEWVLRNARPGSTGGELFAGGVEAVRAAGIPHYRRQHVGHGIGLELYDPVLLTPGNDDVLEEGTIVNVETPYYEFGLGAVQVEDPFVVGAAGNRLLTTLDRNLRVID
jgi:Xaa-Pro aminopeptidase